MSNQRNPKNENARDRPTNVYFINFFTHSQQKKEVSLYFTKPQPILLKHIPYHTSDDVTMMTLFKKFRKADQLIRYMYTLLLYFFWVNIELSSLALSLSNPRLIDTFLSPKDVSFDILSGILNVFITSQRRFKDVLCLRIFVGRIICNHLEVKMLK